MIWEKYCHIIFFNIRRINQKITKFVPQVSPKEIGKYKSKLLLMKKIILLVVLFTTLSNFAQSNKPNEVRLNAFSMIAVRTLDLSYEHHFNEESAVGASFAFSLADKYDLFDNIKQEYAITPYYRYYFPSHVANGLFLEAFLSANGGFNKEKYDDIDLENVDIDDNDEEFDENENELLDAGDYVGLKYSDFAFGIGGGYKYFSETGFVAEIYGGIGRNLSGDERAPAVLPRLGISFGFRF